MINECDIWVNNDALVVDNQSDRWTWRRVNRSWRGAEARLSNSVWWRGWAGRAKPWRCSSPLQLVVASSLVWELIVSTNMDTIQCPMWNSNAISGIQMSNIYQCVSHNHHPPFPSWNLGENSDQFARKNPNMPPETFEVGSVSYKPWCTKLMHLHLNIFSHLNCTQNQKNGLYMNWVATNCLLYKNAQINMISEKTVVD